MDYCPFSRGGHLNKIIFHKKNFLYMSIKKFLTKKMYAVFFKQNQISIIKWTTLQ